MNGYELAGSSFIEAVQTSFRKLVQSSAGVGTWRLYGFERVASTMDVAKEFARVEGRRDIERLAKSVVVGEKEDDCIDPRGGLIILSREQVAGRGRMKRIWHSRYGAGLYVTYLVYPDVPVEHLTGFTLATGLAVLSTINSFGVSGSLKWPNDILTEMPVDGDFRKISGTLVELFHVDKGISCLSIGIGVNLLPDEGVSEVGGISLKELGGEDIDYFSFLSQLTLRVNEVYGRYLTEGFAVFRAEWEEHSMMIGRTVRTADSEQMKVVGIDQRGGLLLAGGDNGKTERTIYSGEVELVDASRD